ncbi:SusC/RagA family TonB-linked outer membrane protein [Sunxiuqinia sp. A32]|uniref:SusC/RagA family TonB-linked outer membrane protein n=1 Tax=Sunxiuqinia sp. A32 TaxID=3461496 RepID=UPI004045EDB3
MEKERRFSDVVVQRTSKLVRMMKTTALLILLMAVQLSANSNNKNSLGNDSPTEVFANQNAEKTVRGTVTDVDGQPVPGVTIAVEGTTKGVITDFDGNYTIDVEPDNTLVFSFVGYVTQSVRVGQRQIINIELVEDTQELDDVTVVAFAKQKKSSVIASISTVKPSELKVPSSNLTTALAGRMSGIISYQRSGEPGQDNAQFFVRGVTTMGYKKDPLILIDGMELTSADLARLQPDDIASFSIMKDATATALYGARGANGVIYVTTKEGVEGSISVNARYEMSISGNTRDLDLADPITYMLMHNEAVRTRNPLEPLPYSQEKIANTIDGVDPVLYPTTDWYNLMFKNHTTNHRFNVNMSGGGKVARYYIAATMNQDNGIMKVDHRNNFNSNIDLKKYQLRTNLNLNLTKTTKGKFIFNTSLDSYSGPINGGGDVFNNVMRTNPVYFAPYYEPDAKNEFTNHILFGNYRNQYSALGLNYYNPYADIQRGYKESSTARILTQIELEQDLSMITEGLKVKAIGYGNIYSFFDVSRAYRPYYYSPLVNPETGEYTLSALNPETGTEYLDYVPGSKDVSTTYYAEGSASYNRVFNDVHGVSGLLVFTMRSELKGNETTLQQSLPYRNMGLAGRFTYAYNDTYFVEANFGYNGSERFAKNNRFGFFPSAGLGYLVSNEPYFESLKKTITKLKLKATYGLVGNDAIGGADDRFFYLSQVNMTSGARGAQFGKFFDYGKSGVSISRYANDQITWETSYKLNVGAEIGLYDKWEVQVDVFHENRTNILMDRIQLASMGLQAGVRANIGEAESKGIDASLDYNQTFGQNWWIQARANFTYAVSEMTTLEEPDYSDTPWLSRVGQSISQNYGYIAEHLFVDEAEVSNSPEQSFGMYAAGDIKYRDVNGDGRISGLDMVPIGNPTSPEIVYGFGFSAGFKSIDFSAFFQGLANESFWIDTGNSAPFINTISGGGLGNNQLLQVWADSYWSEANPDIYARWPRLSNSYVANNMQTSTWFMQDGSFLRLKSMELGFTLPSSLSKKMSLTKCRFYASGTNLLTFSKFKLWDPEMGGNGLGYPVQRVFNLGVLVEF